MKDYKGKRKELRDAKRVTMEEGFESSKERKAVTQSFKRSFRSLKRSEKQAIRKQIDDEMAP
jgi:hypothetical protein